MNEPLWTIMSIDQAFTNHVSTIYRPFIEHISPYYPFSSHLESVCLAIYQPYFPAQQQLSKSVTVAAAAPWWPEPAEIAVTAGAEAALPKHLGVAVELSEGWEWLMVDQLEWHAVDKDG